MLRSLRVANHRSLRDEQELLLMPQYGEERAAVPAVAIYGANASGKSNLLDALRFIQTAVRDSYQRWSPTGRIPRHPFRLDEENAKEPSWYVVEVLIDNVRWTYGFELDDEKVREEWLYTYPQQRKRIIFERDVDGIRFGSTVSHRRDRGRVLEELTRENALFLSLAAQVGLDEVLPMYSWLDGQLRFASHQFAGGAALADYLLANPHRTADVHRLVQAADLGVTGMVISGGQNLAVDAARTRVREALAALSRSGRGADRERAQLEVEVAEAALVKAKDQERSRILLTHGERGLAFDPRDESAGTKSWLTLLPLVLEALSRGDVLVVDELDTSLHPRLAARVVELFRNPATNTGGGQLIFTTHDATLLGTSLGEPVLARDEVWFVSKDAAGASSVFPLSDFKPRKGENTERRYLGGSYGAVPAVFSDTLVDELLRSRERSDAAS